MLCPVTDHLGGSPPLDSTSDIINVTALPECMLSTVQDVVSDIINVTALPECMLSTVQDVVSCD